MGGDGDGKKKANFLPIVTSLILRLVFFSVSSSKASINCFIINC